MWNSRRQGKRFKTLGTALPSVTTSWIEDHPNPTPDEEDLARTSTATFYGAGGDTTVSALESLFLILTLYPDVQRKAQAEMDRVIGLDRLPNFNDRAQLPYLDALLKEVHRWNPVLPIGLPHSATKEDTYGGYHIPAGATVIANSWAVLHDPSLYPDPFDVKPERYLKSEEGINPDPRAFAFGYGRRVCPGQPLAEDSLYIVAAAVLATMSINKAVGPDGLLAESVVRYSGDIINHPGPFQCSISARSVNAECLIMSAALVDASEERGL